MFWTYFVPGLGVSCGAGIGIVGLLLTVWTLNWAMGRTDRAWDFNRQTLAALMRRNELTGEANMALRDIAAAIVEIAQAPIEMAPPDEQTAVEDEPA